jgi:hypothetical protein
MPQVKHLKFVLVRTVYTIKMQLHYVCDTVRDSTSVKDLEMITRFLIPRSVKKKGAVLGAF